MKKGLLALLLTVAMVVPAFAVEKGSMEIVPKVGYVIEPLMMEDYYGDYYGCKQESTFSLGADFYYYVMNNLGAGVGVNYVFDSKFKEVIFDSAVNRLQRLFQFRGIAADLDSNTLDSACHKSSLPSLEFIEFLLPGHILNDFFQLLPHSARLHDPGEGENVGGV